MVEWKPRNTQRARELRNQGTPAERLLWQYLGASRLGGFKFSRQMPVGPYYADFLCRTRKLIVELDGYSHDIMIEADARRDHWLMEEGYRVIRFSNADVLGNVEGVVMKIERVLTDIPTPDPSREREGGRK